ncbi:V-type proton ATPase subunit H-like [Convolutriloba macropyga]|uniref:V-type proton ATPase subunit H-like n=1 Tax=Convolutriloba macropyga TaxID=536237 RepID=UPI003F51D977
MSNLDSTQTVKDMPGASDKLKLEAIDVRDSRINWQSYYQGQIISKEDFEFIQQFDLAPKHRKCELLDMKGAESVKSIMNLLRHIPKDQNLRYILTVVDDLLEEDNSRVDLFVQHSKKSGGSSLSCFLPLLLRPDAFIAHQAARILATICVTSVDQIQEQELDYYFNWFITQLNTTGNEYIQTVPQCLMKILQEESYRQKFVDTKDSVSTIIRVLGKKIGFQLQYQLINCLWLLSFSPSIVESTFAQFNPIPALAAILSEAIKDKVIRITLAFFRNLIEVSEDKDVVAQFVLSMIQCKVPKSIDLLGNKDFDDPELTEDLEAITKKLEESMQQISSFDEYSQEVRSHRLEWSPVHKSDRFWRENAVRLNENNYELLRILTSLLTLDNDALVLAVAAHDIGEYVRCYPRGRRILETLECKTKVMMLMQHPDSSVKYNALVATQKIMVDNWEYIDRVADKASTAATGQTAKAY